MKATFYTVEYLDDVGNVCYTGAASKAAVKSVCLKLLGGRGASEVEIFKHDFFGPPASVHAAIAVCLLSDLECYDVCGDISESDKPLVTHTRQLIWPIGGQG